MLIVFLTNDLVFPSRVRGAADKIGARFETAANADSLIAKLEAEPAVVILDLNAPAVDAASLVPRLKSLAAPPLGIIAFGPHVHEAKLAAAEAAGCDVVLTRGQFDAQMEAVLRRFLDVSRH